MVMIALNVRTTMFASHCWPDAPGPRAYLRSVHMHNFSVTGRFLVSEDDRELEFHDLRDILVTAINKLVNQRTLPGGLPSFGTMSCEQIGKDLLKRIQIMASVFVGEDELHGAEVSRESPAVRIFRHTGIGKRKLVTVCGSTKFKAETEAALDMLERRGHIALSVGSFMHADDVKFSPEEKAEMDLLHLDKIRISDYIYVVNPEGYIGDSTKAEIKLAEKLGIPIEHLFTRNPAQARAAILAFNVHMEYKLAKNDHKGGWENWSDTELFDLMQLEVQELIEALNTGNADDIIDECADVANFAMMIADNAAGNVTT